VRREQRAESEKRESRDSMKWVLSSFVCFGKWFTEIFSVNRFPLFPLRFYESKTNIFRLTSILRRNKRLQILKTFYGKRFQSKQTEPKSIGTYFFKDD
jgi:hypothetical protein